jgi:glucose/arabinose dehydrogenase
MKNILDRCLWVIGLAFAVGLMNAAAAATVSVSLSPNRAAPSSLQGASLAPGNVYIFAANESGLRQVSFYLDPPPSGAVANSIENIAPFDFAGTAYTGAANAFDTSTLGAGAHTMRTLFRYQNGTSQTVTSTFAIAVPVPPQEHVLRLSANSARTGEVALNGSTLPADPAYVFLTPTDDVQRVDFYLDAATTPISTDTAAPLDFMQTAADGSAIAWNPASVANGTHTIKAVVTLIGNTQQTVTAAFTVAVPGSDSGNCTPSICSQIRVALPYVLDFNTDNGHFLDGLGVGTGFTYVLPSSRANPYTAANLVVDPARGQLGIRTTAGIPTLSTNNHTNMLGVGFTGQAQITRLSTRLVAPPNGSRKWEQAGLWFGYDEDHYFKVAYESSPSGNVIEFLEEFAGKTVKAHSVAVSGTPAGVSLDLLVNPYTQRVTAFYAIGSNDLSQLGQPIAAAPEFFSFDAAGIDPEIGTRSFGGIFATHRYGSTPLTYWFDHFSATSAGTGTPTGQATFNRVSHAVNAPTNMAWGPDNRLYVTEMFGTIHALTFDANLNVIQDQSIAGLTALNGKRLTLGIAVDPASTADDVRLWVASSSPSTSAGLLNSGMVTQLSGPNFANVTNVITGLPRAISNHAPNSLHFGPDGRLYIAIGGNTGAGAPTDEENEFGDRPEQWLSAAIVVADVNAASFNGNCTPASIYAQPACGVTTYATGLRNSYDFVFHTNGQLYATDNGLGVTGAYPPQPQPPCYGVGSSKDWNKGGHNPGTQPDLLHRIEQNRYYGHPNPSRSECVFKDGSYQNVAPDLDYTPPLASLGDHMSANGIVEYIGNKVCGAQGSLLIANYSLGQSITQITLGTGGYSVAESKTLVSALSGPLAIASNAAGDIFVSELNSNLVTALRYSGPACSN